MVSTISAQCVQFTVEQNWAALGENDVVCHLGRLPVLALLLGVKMLQGIGFYSNHCLWSLHVCVRGEGRKVVRGPWGFGSLGRSLQCGQKDCSISVLTRVNQVGSLISMKKMILGIC